MRTVVVFGTFDGLHDGHRFLLDEAKKLGDRLVAIVSRDETVQTLKKKAPMFPQAQRLHMVRAYAAIDDARLGDETLGDYRILDIIQPNVVALGYDQDELRADLQRWIKETNGSLLLVSLPRYDGSVGKKS